MTIRQSPRRDKNMVILAVAAALLWLAQSGVQSPAEYQPFVGASLATIWPEVRPAVHVEPDLRAAFDAPVPSREPGPAPFLGRVISVLLSPEAILIAVGAAFARSALRRR